MQCPQVHIAGAGLVDSIEANATKLPDGRWAPSRPLPPGGFFMRIYCAWIVLTGRADALVWPGQ